MKKSGIYGIFESSSNRCLYIGQSINIHKRIISHRNAILNSYHPQKGLLKYANEERNELKGIEFTILCECEESDLFKMEKYYFEKMSPKFFGQVPSENKKINPTKGTREKLSRSMKMYHKENPSESVWNRSVDKYGYEGIKKIMSSFNFSSCRERASIAGMKGRNKPKSEEHKLKISKSVTKMHKKRMSKNPVIMNKQSMESEISKGSVNYASLSTKFNVSRQTIKKRLKEYELIDLFERNYANEYTKVKCSICKRKISKNSMEIHLAGSKCKPE